MRIRIVMDMEGGARTPELARLLFSSLVGRTMPVRMPTGGHAGNLKFLGFHEAEIEEPQPARRTRLDRQEQLGASGREDV